MRCAVTLAVLMAIGVGIQGETISFEAYELQPDGGRKLLARETRAYSPASDVVVVEHRPARQGRHWSKRLGVFGSFELEADVYQQPRLDGFGLVVEERGNPKGFSWEWFDRQEPEVFIKRQGSGRLKVSTAESGGLVELVAIEFLDDVTLRYLDDMSAKQPGEHTHEIVIKKGSVFRMPPGRPTRG